MVIKRKHIIFIVRLSLIALWVPVAVDKLWDLGAFHSSLLRQPFPDWWAGILFWLLPLLEALAAVLIAWRNNRQRIHLGMWLSAVLMLGFTLFILFGVLGWYEKRPCGCGSVISGLSWEDHLWFNTVFLLLAVVGVWLTWPTRTPAAPNNGPRPPLRTRAVDNSDGMKPSYQNIREQPVRFPRKFAVFRRRAWFLSCICFCRSAAGGRKHVTGISTSVTGHF